MPGIIAALMGRHPRMMPAHPRRSTRPTAFTGALSKTSPGNGSLEVEQRVCRIVGYATELAGRGLHPLGWRCLTTAHHIYFLFVNLRPAGLRSFGRGRAAKAGLGGNDEEATRIGRRSCPAHDGGKCLARHANRPGRIP